jgi:hypothetical protein
MTTLQRVEKTTQETFNTICYGEVFAVLTNNKVNAFQTDGTIYLTSDDANSSIYDVYISVDCDETLLSISIILNPEDEENSVTVFFHHDFLEQFNPSHPPKAIFDARDFLLSICENSYQIDAVETILFGLLGKKLFNKVSTSLLMQQALVKAMIVHSH